MGLGANFGDEMVATLVQLDHPGKENHVRPFLRGSGFAAAGLVVGGLLTLLTGVVFARWLKPEAFGTYSIALVTITLLGGLGAAGMDTAVARFVSFYSGSGERHLIIPVIRFGLRWSAVTSVILAGLGYVLLKCSGIVPQKLAVLRSLSLFISLSVPCVAILLVVQHTILGLGGVKTRIAIEKLALPMLRLLIPFGLVLALHNRLGAAVAGGLVATVVVTIVASVSLTRFTADVPAPARPAPENVKGWSRYALPFAFQSLQVFVSAGLGLDIFLVGVLASLSASGVYAAAFRFAPLLTLPRAAMDYAFGPKVSTLFGGSDFAAIDTLYKTSSTIGMAVTLPCAIVLLLLGRPLMSLCFGASYSDGATALSWLVFGFVADSATGCNTTLLAMIGKSGLVLFNGLVGGIFTVGLCFLLIPHFGIAGAAFSATFARSCVNALATAELWKLQRLLPFTTTTWKLALPAILTAAVGIVWKSRVDLMSPSIVMLALSAGMLLLVYMIGLRLTGISWPEWS